MAANCNALIFIVTVAFVITLTKVSGKIHAHGSWNKPYPEDNSTLEGYLDDLAARVNKELVTAHSLTLTDATFNINRTLYGLNVTGTVFFKNGVVSNMGELNRTWMTVDHTRAKDRSTATVLSSFSLSTLSLLYDLEGETASGVVVGTIEVICSDLAFGFNLTHTFATGQNKAVPTRIRFSIQSHTFKPKSTLVYAIKKQTDKSGSDAWYGENLKLWHKEFLAHMIEKLSVGMRFPVSPH